MPQVLIVQHVACESAGTIELVLTEKRVRFEYVRPFLGELVPRSIEHWDALVVMGGPMGVYEQEQYPHLRDEIDLIRDACTRETPVLGICLGSQLLASALGARVAPGPRKEIGWYEVTLSDAAALDPLLRDAPRTFTALHWHGDVFELPLEAVSLASSELTRVQAFRWRNAYGILFHLETTVRLLDGMLDAFRDELAQEQLSADAIRADARKHLPQISGIGRTVFSNWVDLVTLQQSRSIEGRKHD